MQAAVNEKPARISERSRNMPGAVGRSRLIASCALIALAITALGGCSNDLSHKSAAPLGAAGPLAAELYQDNSGGDDWPGYGRTYGEQHFSPLADINRENVGRLKLAWSLDLEPANSSTVPIAVAGVVYFVRGYSIVTAVDGATGKLLWTFDPNVTQLPGKHLRANWGTRGLSWWNGKIYVGTADGRLIAIDAKTGSEVWSAQTTTKGDGRYITGAPRIFDGKVVIGHGGADVASIRGYVTAYDAASGKKLWRFFTVPGNPAKDRDETTRMAAASWSGQWWKYGGGGTVWNAMSYDPATDTLLIGTGNGSPWNQKVRSEGKGDNLFLCSIVALSGRDGSYKWHYQVNPGETWDYNAAMDITLADLKIDGVVRKVAMTAPKNGFFYVIDRTNGKLISAEPYAPVTWASHIDLATGRPVEAPGARYPDGTSFLLRPSSTGAHNWPPMAFSPKRRLVFIPTIEMAAWYTDKGINLKGWRRHDDMRVDAAVSFSYVLDRSIPGSGSSSLLAWDPVTQREVWRVPTEGFWNGGVLATAGDLVFQGHTDQSFNAYDALSGKRVWTFNVGASIGGAPISYRAGGRQFVAVPTGLGTVGGVFGAALGVIKPDYRTQKRRLLGFVLDGRASLPDAPPVTPPELPADSDFKPDGQAAARGNVIFGQHCAVCHGFDMVAGGNAPDLRHSAAPLDTAAFDMIVRGGLMSELGMPKFAELDDPTMNDLRQYIRTRRRE